MYHDPATQRKNHILIAFCNLKHVVSPPISAVMKLMGKESLPRMKE